MALKCKNCKNCKKCKLITFGKVNKKMILLVIGGITYSLQMYIESESIIFGGEKGNEFPVIYTMLYSLSLCLSFIFLILYKVNDKKNKKITSSLIENRTTYFQDIHNLNQKPKTISWIEKLSWILLVSIIVLLRGLAYTLIFNVFNPNFKQEELLPNIVSFVTEIGFSLTYVMYKYFMLIKFIHPFEIMFFEGIFELLFSIITLIIARSMNKLDKIEDFISQFKGIEILIIISWVIAGFIYHSILFKIIDIFTPFYIHMSIIISEIISLFLRVGEKLPIAQILFYVLSFIICPFMILVFIEIIELNFCGLSYMTKKNIELRANLDVICEEENDNNKEKDDEISVGDDEYSIVLQKRKKTEKIIPLESVEED